MNTIVKMKNTKAKNRNNENNVYSDRKVSQRALQTGRRLARTNKQAVLHAYNDSSEY